MTISAAVYVGGVGLGLAASDISVVVWFVVSLAVVVWFVLSLFGDRGNFDSSPIVLGAILVQLTASCAGGWLGKRLGRAAGVTSLVTTPPLSPLLAVTSALKSITE